MKNSLTDHFYNFITLKNLKKMFFHFGQTNRQI